LTARAEARLALADVPDRPDIDLFTGFPGLRDFGFDELGWDPFVVRVRLRRAVFFAAGFLPRRG
jgi:hypothetical protein